MYLDMAFSHTGNLRKIIGFSPCQNGNLRSMLGFAGDPKVRNAFSNADERWH
jgi:hypothetical protein